MTVRVAAYGFIGRHPGDVMTMRFLMPPGSVRFRLRQLFVWPGELDRQSLLLSVRVLAGDDWVQVVGSPRRLQEYEPIGVPAEALFRVAPPAKIREAPGRFDTFVGEAPLCWPRLQNSDAVASELLGAPEGRVAVTWQGELRGLLLVGDS